MALDFEDIEVTRGEDRIERNHYGHYLLPDPYTGEPKAWRRVTTLAGKLKDRYGLERWDQRNVVWGMGQREGLWGLAASLKLDQTQELDEIADRAKQVSDADAGADYGTAIHTFAERVDRGETFEMPERFARDVGAYRTAIELAEISTALGWIERVVCVPELGVCGTLDRLNTHPRWELPRIGDLKSAGMKDNGKRDPIVNYGMTDIPLQMAMYARAPFWWDFATKTWIEMPEVDLTRAMIFHVPARAGECRIYEVDIEAGWQAVQLAMDIERWQKRKDLHELVISISSDGEIGRREVDQIARAAQSEGGDDTEASSTAEAREVTTPGEAQKGEAAEDKPAAGEGVTPSPSDPPAPSSPPPTSSDACSTCRANPGDPHGSACPSGIYGRIYTTRYGDVVMPEYLEDMPGVEHPLEPARLDRKGYARMRVEGIKTNPDALRRLAGLWSSVDAIPTFKNGGPRTWAEVSKVLALCDLVEMEYELPFPDMNDPSPDVELPTPADRRKAERDAETERMAARHVRKRAPRKGAAKAGKSTNTTSRN